MKAEAAALLEAGFSQTAVADKLGLSLSSVKRIAASSKIKLGSKHGELVEAAHESLLAALSSDFARQQLARLILDDISLSARLRRNLATLLDKAEQMPLETLKDCAAMARLLSATATASKLNSDNLRMIIGLAAPAIETDELPTLEVREMLEEEIAAVKVERDTWA